MTAKSTRLRAMTGALSTLARLRMVGAKKRLDRHQRQPAMAGDAHNFRRRGAGPRVDARRRKLLHPVSQLAGARCQVGEKLVMQEDVAEGLRARIGQEGRGI